MKIRVHPCPIVCLLVLLLLPACAPEETGTLVAECVDNVCISQVRYYKETGPSGGLTLVFYLTRVDGSVDDDLHLAADATLNIYQDPGDVLLLSTPWQYDCLLADEGEDEGRAICFHRFWAGEMAEPPQETLRITMEHYALEAVVPVELPEVRINYWGLLGSLGVVALGLREAIHARRARDRGRMWRALFLPVGMGLIMGLGALGGGVQSRLPDWMDVVWAPLFCVIYVGAALSALWFVLGDLKPKEEWGGD